MASARMQRDHDVVTLATIPLLDNLDPTKTTQHAGIALGRLPITVIRSSESGTDNHNIQSGGHG
jgi:hypothetical protein